MKSKNPYTPGSQYAKAAAIMATRIQASRKVASETVARMLHISVANARFMVNVLCNPNHRSNRGTMSVKVGSGIRLRYLTPAQHAEAKTA